MDDRQCTRNNKRRERCAWTRAPWSPEIGLPDPGACLIHMTGDERTAWIEHRDAGIAKLADELHNTPACWRWPAPLACTFANEDIAEGFLARWNRECAICGIGGVLVKDHDHRTGLVRGFLCHACNVQEGMSSGEVFRRYRERNPARILGIPIRYFSPITGWAEPDSYQPDLDRSPGYKLAEYLADEME